MSLPHAGSECSSRSRPSPSPCPPPPPNEPLVPVLRPAPAGHHVLAFLHFGTQGSCPGWSHSFMKTVGQTQQFQWVFVFRIAFYFSHRRTPFFTALKGVPCKTQRKMRQGYTMSPGLQLSIFVIHKKQTTPPTPRNFQVLKPTQCSKISLLRGQR